MAWVQSGVGIFIAAFAAQALAHGPTRQKVEESIVINAPPAKVWSIVGDFNGLPTWLTAVESSTVTDGNKEGSVRTLTVKGGEKLEEGLDSYDPQGMKLRYRAKGANVKVLPVNNYSSTIMVEPEGKDASKVTWRGAFYRGYMNNEPPPELNDEAAIKAVTGLYKTGLQKLKEVAESKK
jgi:carbon monoxide dehydrogenase subunit G